jgi:hypothetical protein
MFFAALFVCVRPYCQGSLTVGYCDFPILMHKIAIATKDAVGPIQSHSLWLEMAKEQVAGKTVDLYLGHILYIPLNLLCYHLFEMFFGYVPYRFAGICLNAAISAIGLVMFYVVLRRSRMSMLGSIIGVLLLGFSWLYAQNSLQNDAGIYAAFSVLLVIFFFSILLMQKVSIIRIGLFWFFFACASLFYMNTVLLIPAIFATFFFLNYGMKWSVAFTVASFVCGFLPVFYSYEAILRVLASHGVWVYSSNIFDLFAYVSSYIKGSCGSVHSIWGNMLLIPLKIGQLLIPLYSNGIVYVVGLGVSYFACYAGMRKVIQQRDATTIFFCIIFITSLLYNVFIVKYVNYTHLSMPLLVAVCYLVALECERVMCNSLRDGHAFPVRQYSCFAVVGVLALNYGIGVLSPGARFMSEFCKIPSTDKTMLNREVFSYIKNNTDRYGIVIYDSGYIDRILGSMLLLYADRLSPLNFNPNVLFLGGPRPVNKHADIATDKPLKTLVERAGGAALYVLSTRTFCDSIAIPSDDSLSYYCVFNKAGTYAQWGVFELDSKNIFSRDDANRAIAASGGVMIQVGRTYVKEDLCWSVIRHSDGRKTLMLVPAGPDVFSDPKDRYICYW